MEDYETLQNLEPTPMSTRRMLDHLSAVLVGRAAVVAARLVLAVFAVLSSAYCLLAYVPFTYQWVISFNLIGWLPAFVRFHPLLFWLVFGLNAASLTADLKREKTKKLVGWFWIASAAAGVGILIHPPLASLQNDGMSFIWSVLWLFPLIWVGTIDGLAGSEKVIWKRVVDRDRRTLLAACITATFVPVLYWILFFVRGGSNSIPLVEELSGFVSSVALHFTCFGLLFALLKIINSFAKRFKNGAWVEFLLCHLLVGLCAAMVLRRIVLAAIAFNSMLADLFALGIGISIAVFVMGLNLRRHETEEITDGLSRALSPLMLNGLSLTTALVGTSVVIGLIAWGVPTMTAMKDWDFLVQKISAIVIWPLSFACFYRVSSTKRNQQYKTAFVISVAAIAVVGIKFADLSATKLSSKNGPVVLGAAIERYSAYDLSLRALREASSQSQDESLYEYLRAYTNILPSTRVAPVQINLVDNLQKTAAKRPNIFVFVVDSLRRDYLSPYNESVNFTPNIERLARDGVVMNNAFTRYGGTALSEPAIWAGSMLLHKQYILPFYPMNSLQRLLDADQYQSFISMDPILKELLRPSESIVELDKRGDGHDFDFCFSLKELERRVDERLSSAPMFVYSQPWNVHTHVIAVEGRTVAGGESFPGFWAPYASRVKYMDECLGEFIEYLKSRNLYDESIIVLTSDHGDALGEDGRWGHSYWLYPEIIRVPLIVHLPKSLKQGLMWDADAIAFSTDITPSLYYLLGHRPINANNLFGRPLFVERAEERERYARDEYVVTSSYGAAYGVLSGNGRWLFVADGVKDKEQFFDLTEKSKSNLDHFTVGVRNSQKKVIRDYIGAVNEFYGLKEKPQTAGAYDAGWQGRPSTRE